MQQLCLMSLVDRIRSLQFNDNPPIHYKVRSKNPNKRTSKTDRHRKLDFNSQPSLPQSNPHSLSVNRLQKTKPKFVVNLIENPNNLLSQRVIRPRKLPTTHQTRQSLHDQYFRCFDQSLSAFIPLITVMPYPNKTPPVQYPPAA